MARAMRRNGRDGKPLPRWYASWTDAGGKTRMRAGYTDKRRTLALARELEHQSHRERIEGPPPEPEQARRPSTDLATVVPDYIAHLLAKGSTAKHVEKTRAHIQREIEASGWGGLDDIKPEDVDRRVSEMKAQGLAAGAINARLRAVKGLTRWAWRNRRISYDPLAGVSLLRTTTDRRLERRALTDAEIVALLAYTDAAPERVTVPKRSRRNGELREGSRTHAIPRRGLLWRVLLGTGLRVGEARRLTPRHLDLDGTPPAVRLGAGETKNRREVRQPIRPELADRLRAEAAGLRPTDPIWPRLPGALAAVLRADMEAARAAWAEAGHDVGPDFLTPTDSRGRVTDAHALRHTFITRLAREGVSVKHAQELARHADPRLTIATYSHASAVELAAALPEMPAMGGDGDTSPAHGLETGEVSPPPHQ